MIFWHASSWAAPSEVRLFRYSIAEVTEVGTELEKVGSPIVRDEGRRFSIRARRGTQVFDRRSCYDRIHPAHASSNLGRANCNAGSRCGLPHGETWTESTTIICRRNENEK
jgi:hypothetical protein